MGGSCMTLINILNYSFVLITTVVACVAFGMTVHSYRQVRAAQGKDGNPSQGRKMSGSTWNKVADDGSKSNRSKKPPPRARGKRNEPPPKRNRNEDVIRSPREGPSIHSFDF